MEGNVQQNVSSNDYIIQAGEVSSDLRFLEKGNVFQRKTVMPEE